MLPPGWPCLEQAGTQKHSIKITSSPLSASLHPLFIQQALLRMLCPQTCVLRPGPTLLLLTVLPVLEPGHFQMHHFHSFQLFFILRALNLEQAVSIL